MIESFIEFSRQFDSTVLYAGVFLWAYLENVFPPVPGDTVTIAAAALVGAGELSYLAVFLCATIGNVSGFTTLYFLGRRFGKGFFLRKRFRFFPPERIEKAERWFGRYGYKIILFNRFMSGVRSVISLVSGITRLRISRVVPLAFLSCCMWDGLLIYGGSLLGTNWKTLDNLLARYNTVALSLIVLIVVIFSVRAFLRRKSASS